MLNPELAKIYPEKVQVGLQPVVDFFESKNIPAYVIGTIGENYNITMPSMIVWDDNSVETEADRLIMDSYFAITEDRRYELDDVLYGIVSLCNKTAWEDEKERALPLWVS